jgi:hypothetical protein
MFSLMLTGFGCNLFRSQSVPKKARITGPAIQLISYFPQKVGTVWEYNGMAEYASKMRLESKKRSGLAARMTHLIGGQVADMSGGESKANFNFKIAYQFTPISVYEKIIFAGRPFPHTIKYLRMLAMPLDKGRTWQQQIIVDGKPAILKAEIINTGQEKILNRLRKTVTVRYRVPMAGMPQGIYEEIRLFAQGLGVVRFEKTFDSNPNNRFNYFLFALKIPSHQK